MMKKKYILPLVVFLAGTGILGGIVYNTRKNEQRQNRMMANLNAMTYAEHMETDFSEGISAVNALEQILVSENGQIEGFSQVAKNMMTDCIQSIQIAPDGVVTEIYPEKGNEAGKIDLLHDKDRGEISNYAKEHHVLTMQGPFKLKQGGYGLAVRNPVYLEDENGAESFWGFTIVIIRVPDIFADSIKGLSGFGYSYELSKTVSPWNDTYEEVYHSGEDITDPVAYEFEMGGSRWKLEVMPKNGWINTGYSYGVFGGGMIIVLLLTGLTVALLVLDEHRKKFQKLAVTDGLTGIYNRQGFDDLVAQYLKQHPKDHCVVAQFDVDDFKLINDMYGHAAGDHALQILADGMRRFFQKEAVVGRSGGDEFCIFLPGKTSEQAKQQIEAFTKLERSFVHNGEKHTFNISLGYAEYPVDAKDQSLLMRCADAALYEVKMRGKHGALEYKKGIGMEIRTRLGFALRDVSENLPGAFLIYKADPADDELLFANREMIRMAGCSSIEELLAYTDHHFRNLIREDERENVERSIWNQIGDGSSNDYVYFHMKKQDGTYLQVLDHGRIVKNGSYGQIFYVLIMDWASMKRHYRESF